MPTELFYIYVGILLVSVGAGFVVAVLTHKTTTSPASKWYIAAGATIMWWALGGAITATMGAYGASVGVLGWLSEVTQSGAFLANNIFLLFALRYAGREKISRRILYVVLGTGVVQFGVGVTNGIHGIVWSNYTVVAEPFRRVTRTETVVFELFLLGDLLFYITALVVLGRYVLSARGQNRSQLAAIAVAPLFPWSAVLAEQFNYLPKDLHVGAVVGFIGFAIVGAAMFNYDLFRYRPVAREMAFNTTHDGIIVVAGDGHVVDYNKAAVEMFPDIADYTGEPLKALHPALMVGSEPPDRATSSPDTPSPVGENSERRDTPGQSGNTWPDGPTASSQSDSTSCSLASDLGADFVRGQLTDADADGGGEDGADGSGSSPTPTGKRGRGADRGVDLEHTDANTLKIPDEVETYVNGERHIYEVSPTPIEMGGEVRAYTILFRDVTAERERAEQYRREREQLDRFVSVVSHDLRNPLAVAEGYLEELRRHTNSDEVADHDMVNKSVDEIEVSLEQIGRMIDDALMLARSGRAIEDRTVESLSQTVTDAAETVGIVQNTSATVVNNVPADVHISADHERLGRAFENLFRNAVDHGPLGVTITVRVDLESGTVHIDDNGPGIPEEKHDVIFERGVTTSDDGTGLGLAIVTEIVEAHGWLATVDVSPSGGSRFSLTEIEFVEHQAGEEDTAVGSPKNNIE